MEKMLQVLMSYGYWAIFLAVLVDFLGAPITVMPLLVIGGALASSGKLSLTSTILLAALAALLADFAWYGLGRASGQKALGLLCWLSRDRGQCVTRSTQIAAKYGAASLLISKFVPGLAMFAPPAAGTAGMSLAKFTLLDVLGSLLWATLLTGLGFVLGERLHGSFVIFNQLGSWVLIGWAAMAILAFLSFLKNKYSLFRKVSAGGS